MLVVVLSQLACAAALPAAARRIGRGVWAVAALVLAGSLAWLLTRTAAVLDGTTYTETYAWSPTLGLEIALRLDPLALLMALVVTGVGVAVMVYGAYYHHLGHGREAALLLAFAAVMLGLVLADHLLLLYVFWELTSVASFLLIAGRREGGDRQRAAEQALLTTVAGGLAMLFGMVMLGRAAGTYRISALLADPPPAGAMVTTALVLILIGAFAKSAQFPLHAWLPAAMAAPTSVSAYLHAATMVKAGVYLVARLAPGFADVAPWRPLVLTVGLYTLVVGAWRALRETDMKRLLAYGTVSELGMMIALFGMGTRTGAIGGAVLLLSHALFKGSLFMVVGVVDHQTGTRDLRELSGLGRALPAVAVVALLAGASMAKLPPTVGWIAQDGALEAMLHGHLTGAAWATAALCLGSVLTVTYTARLLQGGFATKRDDRPRRPADPPRPLFLAPAAVLSVLGLVAGLWYPAVDALTAPYADQYPEPTGKPFHAALWHGWTPVVWLALLIVVLGLALHTARRPFSRLLRRLPRLPDAERCYRRGMIALHHGAVVFTRYTQVGSLPLYLTAILLTVVVLPSFAVLTAMPPLDQVRAWWTPAELPLAVIVVIAAACAAMLKHRLAAVLVTGAVGYAVAGLFVVQGAPDLALTQFLVESLTLVVVVLVLRRMPSRFTPASQTGPGRWARAAVALLVGLFVAGFALTAPQGRENAGPAGDYLRRVGETGGENVVNAIVVDFRALDTLGEISVLMVTALGVISLIRLGTRTDTRTAAGRRAGPDVVTESAGYPTDRWDEPREHWLPGSTDLLGAERSVLMEVVTRLLFPSILVVSLFLLFSGHYRPGGGFSGGLVAGQAFILRYLVGGPTDVEHAVRVRPGHLIGVGLTLAATTAMVPLAFGDPPLTSTLWSFHLPLLGQVKTSSSLVFDIGVYLLILGVILTLLSAAGTSLRAPVPKLGTGGGTAVGRST
ncbi:Na+/H+ antiporter subunit A [Streptomyces sp. UH6]|uniref:Na+/H+ antiporter subunit A n=1 Tax=Streptomyces sp. UH6 TaxID=2748379 RepID=UPI0015D4D1AE|nr:Na+/H+ antiporter subunit A [Streptomyces sp. UH6]NYV75279.1 Na+/H+ antiporter subunit A [Streptomyces sp. UH6]